MAQWNFRLPADPQDYSWDCAACSLAWCLRAAGLDYSEQEVIYGLGPSRISPTYGLLDASGAGLVSYLAEIGVTAENNGNASWDEVMAASGSQPMLIGGRNWCHWTGVRMGSLQFSQSTGYPDVNLLALMNPANGWMGVYQSLSPEQFSQLGSFSAVWFTSW